MTIIKQTFTATIQKDDINSGWTCVLWPESAEFFGTRKPVKVLAEIEGHEFQTTFMPFGNGAHMLPLKAAVMRAIHKRLGDTVVVELKERL